MKKRFMIFNVLFFLLLSSCGKAQEEVEWYTGTLEQEALEQGHLNLVLSEDVTVDADITPYEAYKNGMTSYFLARIPQTGEDFSREDYESVPVVFGQEVQELCNKFVQENGGSISYEDMEVVWDGPGVAVLVPYRNEAGSEIQIQALSYYSEGEQGLEASEVYFRKDGYMSSAYYGKILPSINPYYEKKDLDFADAEQCGERIRLFLQDFSGREISSDYDIIPIDEELYRKLEADYSHEEESDYDGDYYTFKYRYDIDGFRWENLQLTRRLTGKEELSAEVEFQRLPTDEVRTLDEWNQVVCSDKEGIACMELSSYADISDVYREKADIVPIEDILSQVQGYFEEMLLINPVKIYDIKLVYSSSFSYNEDGPLRNVVRPFWIIKYSGNGNAQQLVYDAYTGEFQTVEDAS